MATAELHDPAAEFELALDRSIEAPSQARHALSKWLMRQGCPAKVVVNMTLVTSELVTNAVVHAESAPRLVAVIDARRVRLEVHDQAAPPPVRSPALGAIGGRGLHVVETVADSWGWSPTASGKYVWAEMAYVGLRRPADVVGAETTTTSNSVPPS